MLGTQPSSARQMQAHAHQMLGDEENNNNNRNPGNLNSTWYGIYCPQTATPNRVFTDVKVAAEESKKLNARFKRFASEEEARHFAETGYVDTPVRKCRPMLQENTEKSPARKGAHSSRSSLGEDSLNAKTCPSVPQRELSKLRIAIEKGELQVVTKSIHDNPRYLISSYDKPVTLQPGPHYNALHCAAKTGQQPVAEHIMDYLLSDEPWRKLYPNEDLTSAAHIERRNVVIDGYFNTSDKGCGETPLHFACKFGHLGFARWLLTFNHVDITRRNKYDQTAVEVAGSRCAEAEEVHEKVGQLVQESRHSVYVPVIRAVDNSTPPFLGQPVTPEYLHFKRKSADSCRIILGDMSYDDSLLSADFMTPNSESSFLLRNSLGHSSPLSPSLSICAYAGPMLASEAKEFRKVWKTPPRELSSRRRDMLQGIMRSDSDRGLERVGRDLAVQQKVSWHEYWGFLDSFVNLRDERGLEELERYLLENDDVFISGDSPSKLDQDVLHALPPGGITQLSDRFPNICNWYQKVLTFPEDERKCWTTPVAVRKILSATPRRPHNDNIDTSGLVRNLMSDLTLEDIDVPATDDSACTDHIKDILVQGVSNLSISETNKLFPKKKHINYNIEIKDDIVPPSPLMSTPKEDKLPLPITTIPANRWHRTSSPNEPRQRYPKSSNSELNNSLDAQARNRGVRRYFSFQVMRWLLLFIVIWMVYFIYMYLNSDFLLPDEDRHL